MAHAEGMAHPGCSLGWNHHPKNCPMLIRAFISDDQWGSACYYFTAGDLISRDVAIAAKKMSGEAKVKGMNAYRIGPCQLHKFVYCS